MEPSEDTSGRVARAALVVTSTPGPACSFKHRVLHDSILSRVTSLLSSLLYFPHFSFFLGVFCCSLHFSTLFTSLLYSLTYFSLLITSLLSSLLLLLHLLHLFSRLYFLTCLKIRILRKPWFHRGWNHSFGTTIEWGCWRWMELIVPYDALWQPSVGWQLQM